MASRRMSKNSNSVADTCSPRLVVVKPKMAVNNSKLRQSKPPELSKYFFELLKNHDEESISTHVLAGAESESLPPNVVQIWLTLARAPESLLAALTQEFSVTIRRIAIKRTFKLLRRKHWRETWEGLGGTPSLLLLLKRFSVFDVKLCIARLISFANGPNRVEKQSLVEEVLQGLLPLLYPNAPFKTADERPLANYYKLLLPGCSSKFVEEILRDSKSPLRPDWTFERKTKSSLLRDHYDILRAQSLEKIFAPADTMATYSVIKGILMDGTDYFNPLLQEYPPLPSPQRGVSESMAFSLLVLRRAAAQPGVNMNISVINSLVGSLLFRARKKKVDFVVIREILDLSMAYLLSRPDVAKLQKLNQNNRFLTEYVKLWASLSTDQDKIEGRLISLFKMMPSNTLDVGVFNSVSKWARKPLRYRFLKLLFLHIGEKGIDLDDTMSLSRFAIKHWPCTLFTKMDRENAIVLLIRLRNSSPHDNFLAEQSGTILSRYASQGNVQANSSILLNVLEEGEPCVLERATAAVEEMKKKAVKSREQNDRAFNISAAVLFAISSASIELYKETLLWTRRFVRDPLTAITVFSNAVTNTIEGIRLLSGFPDHFQGLRLHDMVHRIQLANDTIFDAFETACSALKEPSFHRPHWEASFGLFAAVVHRRLSMSKRVQKVFDISDDVFYDLIFKGTLELGLRIERTGLQPGYEPLQLRNPFGPLSSWTLQGLDSVPALRFIDNLAKERDSLWQAFRPTLHPAVAALPAPLPRGLPIQCLKNGLDFSLITAGYKLPYICSRAEAVLFAKPDEALTAVPEDEETRSAIGTFVDNFSVALQIYYYQAESVATRRSRAIRVWYHCIDELSTRMTPDEAHRTWKKLFKFSLRDFEITEPNPQMSMEYPVFPFGAEVGAYTEWNPAEGYNPQSIVQMRVLKPLTYLDCTINWNGSFARTDLNEKFVGSYLHTEGFYPLGSLWNLKRMSREQLRTPALREGLIVSALLFLEDRIPGHKSAFLKPFPSAADVRYPDMWLDLSFAEGHEVGPATEADAFKILESFRNNVPSTLLYRLTEASLSAVFSASREEWHSKIANLEGLAYGFLSRLSISDRPSLATKLILKTICERPDSSSWHRKLLTGRFLRSLPTAQAKGLIQSFSDAIQEKSKDATEAAKETVKAPRGSPKKVAKPYIKITTVKYLAQLLEDSNFIPEDFAVDVLGSLLRTSPHIDIRTAIVQSLMEILSRCTLYSSDSLGDRILKVLEFAIPISGSLDERRQLSDEDWEEVKNTGELPDIYEEGSIPLDRCVPPIISAIYNPLICNNLEVRWRSKVFQQILIPILETSIAENTRWLEIFMAKHDLDLHSLNLPLLPVKMKVLKDLLQYDSCYFPGSTMDMYLKFVLTNMSPPREVAALNNKFLDPAFRDIPEVKHWLSLYGHGPKAFSYDGFNLINVLRKKWVYPEGSGISPLQLQNHLFEQAKVLLLTNNPTDFNTFITLFQPWRYPDQFITSTDWLLNARQPLKRIISLIHTLRTPQWQRNSHRQPEVLPQTLRYRLWLAPYPTFESTEAEIAAFATAVRGFVEEICQPKNLYHEELPEVTAALDRVMPIFRAQIACLLGALRDDMSQIDLVCVELAKTLFASADVPKNPSTTDMSNIVVTSWRDSVDENTRKKGMELSKRNGMGKLQDISGGFGFLAGIT